VVAATATTTIGSFQRGDAPLNGAHRALLLLKIEGIVFPTLEVFTSAGCATTTGTRAGHRPTNAHHKDPHKKRLNIPNKSRTVDVEDQIPIPFIVATGSDS
jgi:hypothetical protein